MSDKNTEPRAEENLPSATQQIIREISIAPEDTAKKQAVPEGDGPSLKDMLNIFRKRRACILLSLITFFIASLLYCFLAPKKYKATVGMEIRGYGPILAGASAERMLGTDTRKENYRKTTIAKLRRLNIADATLSRENLLKEVVEYLETRRGLLGKVRELFKPRSKKTAEQRYRNKKDTLYRYKEGILRSYLGLVNVRAVHETAMVELSVTTTRPLLSQKIANNHAKVFIERLQQERQETILANLLSLEEQADKLKAKVAKAEQAVTKYAEENDLVSLANSQEENMVLREIGDLTKLLAEATAKRIKSESLLRELTEGVGVNSPTVDDESTRQLRLDLKQAEAEYQSLRQKMTPLHPKMIEKKTRIDTLRSSIRQEREQNVRAVKTEYQSDLTSEQRLLEQIAKKESVANKTAKRLVQYNLLGREAGSLRDLYQAVLKQLKETQISAAGGASNIFINDLAALPQRATGPKRRVILSFGVGIGLIVGIGIALLLEVLDNTLSSSEDVQSVLKLPSLGIIPSFPTEDGYLRNGADRALLEGPDMPKSSKKISREARDLAQREPDVFKLHDDEEATDLSKKFISISSPRAAVSEALRTIRASILLSSADRPPRVIMVTSANKHEGKTTLASNLAVTLAQASQKTLLIDADLRRATMNLLFDVPVNSKGLVDYLAGQTDLEDVIQNTQVENLSVITAGSRTPNPVELLGSGSMSQLIKDRARDYDYVLIDTPPVLPVADSLMLSRIVDGVVFVARSNKTEKNHAQEATRRLDRVGARILGVVLNDVDVSKVGDSFDRPTASYYVDVQDDKRSAIG